MRFAFALITLCAGIAFAAKAPEAQLMIQRENHRAAVVHGANLVESFFADRGCFTAGDTCASVARINEVTGALQPKDTLVAAVDGTGVANTITLTRNNEVVFSMDNVALPFELPQSWLVGDNDDFVLSVLTGSGVTTAKAATNPSASTTAFDNMINVNIRYFVPYRGALAEVITNGGGGGAFIPRSASCAIASTPVSSCPSNRVVRYFTDRASRGESILTRFDGGTGLSFANIFINHQLRVGPIPFFLPTNTLGLQQVSPDVNDDDIVITITSAGIVNSRRVPVGSR